MLWGDEPEFEDASDVPDTFDDYDGPETIALGLSEHFGDCSDE